MQAEISTTFIKEQLEGESVPVVEMATIKKSNNWGNEVFRVAVHGPTEQLTNSRTDRPNPHIHIYWTKDGAPYPNFNFEISLVDIFAKNEYNLAFQNDRITKNKPFKAIGDNCTWANYKDIKKGLESLLKSKGRNLIKNDVECKDYLHYAIESYNEESRSTHPNPFLEYIIEHDNSLISLPTFKANIIKYYPTYYKELYEEDLPNEQE